jgi:hypothetical protein
LIQRKKKLTRQEAVAIAQTARKLPVGVISDRVHLQIPESLSSFLQSQNSAERGTTYSLGAAFEANGYLMLYALIEALGGRITTTIIDSEVTIVTRHKTYEGKNQAELLLQIIRDRLEAIKENNDEET